ncbi:hypothetical protein LTR62_006597 [Meristemomyces frigidus]|uniref:SCP domain-containing protein n=1 Tax=Meristemomyces frigidus TaxID=1508187 RepID=A0AAN7TN70_9PEZI|nr:hypothetical protein LTR62_006597 [Meristemomyces frigidus]
MEAATGTQTPSTTGPVATGAISFAGEAFQSAVLNSTNYHRAQHQASSLVWNSTLASFAQSHASKCLWQHSGGPNGENLASGYISPIPAIDAWADEESKYNYRHPGFHESTGHFTQLVWKSTTSVGCAATQCDNAAVGNGAKGWLMVCEYSPPGNVGGEFREEVSKAGENGREQLGFGLGERTVGGVGKRVAAALVVLHLLGLFLRV